MPGAISYSADPRADPRADRDADRLADGCADSDADGGADVRTDRLFGGGLDRMDRVFAALRYRQPHPQSQYDRTFAWRGSMPG